MTFVGWPGAAYGIQLAEGKCRLGYGIDLTSSTPQGPYRIFQRTSNFARKIVRSSLGGEVFALSEMEDHILLSKEFYGPSEGVDRGVGGLEACESLVTRLKTKKMAADKFLAGHFLGIRQALREGDLENAYCLPGTENPADGLAIVRGDVVPLVRPLEAGRFYPGHLRSLGGVAWEE